MSKVKVIAPGPLTTIQDGGRYRFQVSGMSVSGVMDAWSQRTANILVGNDENEAVIEATMMAPSLEFLGEAVVAVTGGEAQADINGTPVPMWQTLRLRAGDKLSFKMMSRGCRLYIAFAGGIDVPVVMGSKSTYLKARVGGLEGRLLRRDDEFGVNAEGKDLTALPLHRADPSFLPALAPEVTLRVVPGFQDDAFTEEGMKTFFSTPYTVTPECDRMGYRLEGAEVAHTTGADIISDGIVMGAIQVPGSGKPIILMSDRQTTGGYTKIGAVVTADLPLVGQSRPGTVFHFKRVSVEEGQQSLLDFEEKLKAFKQKLQPAQPVDAAQAAPAAAPAPAPQPAPAAAPAGEVPVPVQATVAHLQAQRSADPYRVGAWPPPKTERYRVTLNGVTWELELERIPD